MQSDSLTLKTVAQIVLSFNNLLVNKKLASVNINVADLLNGNYILLLFVVLALGLCLGKLRLGSVQLGNSIGVLVVSLLLGQQHFSINTDALNLGFMLFIFLRRRGSRSELFFHFLPRRQKLPDAGAGDGRQRPADCVRAGQTVWLGHRLNGRYAGRLDDLHAGACWRGGIRFVILAWQARSFPPRWTT